VYYFNFSIIIGHHPSTTKDVVINDKILLTEINMPVNFIVDGFY